jgi:hypothetical protein
VPGIKPEPGNNHEHIVEYNTKHGIQKFIPKPGINPKQGLNIELNMYLEALHSDLWFQGETIYPYESCDFASAVNAHYLLDYL